MRNLSSLRTRFAVAGLLGVAEALRQVRVTGAGHGVMDSEGIAQRLAEARVAVVRSPPVSRQA